MMFREIPRHDGGQPVDRTDRKVESASNEDERPRRRDCQRGRLLVQDVDEVRRRKKRSAPHGQHDEEDDEGNSNTGESPGPEEAEGAESESCRVTGFNVERLFSFDSYIHDETVPSVVGSANAAASTACSFIRSPESSVIMRPWRMTRTRCARPSTSS